MTRWDEAKRAENISKHGVDLSIASGFDFVTAVIEKGPERGLRKAPRRAVGVIDDKLYMHVYTLHDDEEDHAISLRRAPPRERRDCEQS